MLADCLRARSFRGTEFKEHGFRLVKCQQILPFHVGKSIWCMAAILGHEGEINQRTNIPQGNLKIVILRTVRISQGRRQYGRNTPPKVPHFLSLPLCDFSIGLFWYTELWIRRNFFPGIVECLLLFMPFQEPFYLLHHMFE